MNKCPYCNENTSIANPTGRCNHVYFPDYVNVSLYPEYRIKELKQEITESKKRTKYLERQVRSLRSSVRK